MATPTCAKNSFRQCTANPIRGAITIPPCSKLLLGKASEVVGNGSLRIMRD